MDRAPEVIDLTPGPAIAIRARMPMSELPAFFGAAFHELAECGGAQIAGPPFAVYHSVDPPSVDVSAVFPLRAPVTTRGRVVAVELAGGPAVRIEHVGPYEELAATYQAIEGWMARHHRAPGGDVREVYLSMPTVPPAEQVTHVIQPLRPASSA